MLCCSLCYFDNNNVQEYYSSIKSAPVYPKA